MDLSAINGVLVIPLIILWAVLMDWLITRNPPR